MILPAAVLNEPIIYNNGRPKYMKYGSLGFWIGHEITHGFDTKGRFYDKDEKLVKGGWWDSSTVERFNFLYSIIGFETLKYFKVMKNIL